MIKAEIVSRVEIRSQNQKVFILSKPQSQISMKRIRRGNSHPVNWWRLI